MRRRDRATFLFALAIIAFAAPPSSGATHTWYATEGVLSLSIDDAHLASLGLNIADTRTTAESPALRELMMEPTVYSFEVGTDVGVRLEDGHFAGFEAERASLPVRGGLAFGARHPGTRSARTPAFVFDFSLVFTERNDHPVISLSTNDAAFPAALEARNFGFAFDPVAGELSVRVADLVITRAWAERLGQPELSGQWIGGLDLRLRGTPPHTDHTTKIAPGMKITDPGPILDVTLGELYDMGSEGRIGLYPNGVAGLAAATTSCNSGEVDVPWREPMNEQHPFIGLAMFRVKNDVLEMIGQNWMKHGWYALSNDQCFIGCPSPSNGTFLAIGCSDTYSAINNGSRYVLGPRDEVNPHTGDWTALGSYFDATPVDGNRDYFGAGHDGVEHRLEIPDAVLADSTAQFFYEGCYFVKGDDVLDNNIGWRECVPVWGGAQWLFTEVPSSQGFWRPEPGPVVLTWGDQHDIEAAAPDDGLVMLAVKVTDLGGGTWHYEYAFYNRTSHRALHSFSVPIGTANLSNVGFHDIDGFPADDWTPSVAGGMVTWATDDYATDPDANALKYQMLFNFRFDADQAPVSASAAAQIFRPGIGTTVFLDTQAPASATSVLAGPASSEFDVLTAEPNPFAGATRVRFTLPRDMDVRLSVLDVTGRVVQTLLDGPAPSGESAVNWNGRDAGGARVASGVYFFRLESDRNVRTVKGTLLN